MKHYLIRLDCPLQWCYWKSDKGCRVAAEDAKKRFGPRLRAFEPAPVKPKKGREVYQ